MISILPKDDVDLSGVFLRIMASLYILLTQLFHLFNMIPSICNTFRHKETREASGNWLEKRVGAGFFRNIEKISYTTKGILQAKLLMDELSIPDTTTGLPGAVTKRVMLSQGNQHS